jgi:hypothetical protein
MHAPPNAEMRRAALLAESSPKSHPLINQHPESSRDGLDLQARKLRRLFFFCHATACTIATLAYGVAR